MRSPAHLSRIILVLLLSVSGCWKVDPDLELSTHELTFGPTTNDVTITVTNDSKDNALTSGVTDLDYQFESDRSWITIAPVSGHLREEESTTHTISVDRSALLLGDNLATIRVTSNGGNASITVLAVRTPGDCISTPSAPTGPSPADDVLDVALSASLSWNNGESRCDGLDATYDVYFGTTSPPPFVRNNGRSKTFDPGTLSAATLYYWRVVAKDVNGSTTSATWSFSTAGATTCNEEPSAPSSLLPPNDADDLPLDQNLSWSGGESQCDGLNATYDVYFGTTSPPPFVRNNGSSKTFDPGTLSAATLYYWRVVAKDANGSTTSATRSFSTAGVATCNEEPSALSSLSPPNGADDIPLTQDLSWSGGESECPGLTATYDVYFGTASPAPLHHNNGTDKNWDPGALEAGRTYYWRIVARDENGSRSSGERSFRTLVPCVESVTAPCTPSPPNGKTNVNEKQDLKWECGVVECGSGPVTYVVYLGTSSSLDEDDRLGTTTRREWKLPDLRSRTTYYWRVIAQTDESSASSPVWTFTTR